MVTVRVNVSLSNVCRTSPAPVTIKTSVSIEGAIKSIESLTHRTVVSDQGPVPGKKQWTKVTVELTGKTSDMDRDFVLLVKQLKPTSHGCISR